MKAANAATPQVNTNTTAYQLQTDKGPGKVAKANQDRYLAYLKQGKGIDEVCASAGVQRVTRDQWRARFRGFRLEEDYVLGRRGAHPRKAIPDLEEFFNEHSGLEIQPHQREWLVALNDKSVDRLLLLAPANHGKTTILNWWIT